MARGPYDADRLRGARSRRAKVTWSPSRLPSPASIAPRQRIQNVAPPVPGSVALAIQRGAVLRGRT